VRRGLVTAGILVAALCAAGPAQAADFTVTRGDDPAPGACAPGDCSLREAVNAANAAGGDDRVLLGARTVTPTLGEITFNANGVLTVLGQGAGVSVIDGSANPERIFQGGISSDLVLDSLTIRDGESTNTGGAVQLLTESTLTVRSAHVIGNSSGNSGGAFQLNGDAGTALTVTDSLFDGNSADNSGGAIQMNTPSELTVERSYFVRNTAVNSGGAIQTNSDVITRIDSSTFSSNRATGSFGDGGALQINSGLNTFTVTNSTFTGNRAEDGGGGSGGRGGAIQVNGGKVSTLNNVTIAGNAAIGAGAEGGGIGTGLPAAVTLRNSIVANNTASTNVNCAGPFISGGFNLESADTCGFGATDLRNTNPLLAPLGDYGGPVPTMAFGLAVPGRNPAINAGDPGGSCAPVDARGVPRKGDRCDIGAYELKRCRGVAINRVGTAAADVLFGTPKKDGFLLLGGNDRAKGGKGIDGMCGNAGNDVLRGGPGHDLLKGGAGRDRLFGQGGTDALSGGGRKDLCVGGKNGKKGKDKAKGCERVRSVP
jgi:CSLREA domain-containing protein